jgi:actin-related protein 10
MNRKSFNLDEKLVLDIGSRYTKYGYSSEPTPRAITKTMPIQELLQLIKTKLCLQTKPKIMLIEDVNLEITKKRILMDNIFKQGYESITFINQSLSALLAVGGSVGLVLDVGYHETTVVPIYEYIPLLHYHTSEKIGIRNIISTLHELLINFGQVFLDNELSPTNVDDYLTNELLENLVCQISVCRSEVRIVYDPAELENDEIDLLKISLNSNTYILVPSFVRSQCAQILYDSEHSIANLVLDSVLKCPIDLRNELLQNVLLIGGGVLIPGFKSNLIEELVKCTEKDGKYANLKRLLCKIGFTDNAFIPNITAWVGASLATSSKLGLKEIGREDYLATGYVPDWTDPYPCER